MDLDLTRIFVKVVRLGSFSKAAENLTVPKSTVSKAVSKLESEAGAKLLLRTTRSLTLTEAGRHFYEICFDPIQILEDAAKSLQGRDQLISGVVRLTAPEDLGANVIAPAIVALTRKYKDLSFDLQYTDEIVDLVKDGFDLAIRLGKLRESRLKAKRLGEISLIPVASPAYIKRSEKIRTPQDLKNHDCLSISIQSQSSRWHLRGKGETVNLDIRSRVVSNQMTSLLKMAKVDAGVALIPRYLCQPELKAGQLIEVLPDWSAPATPVWMISPLASSSSARLKLTMDHLQREIQAALLA